MADAIDRNQLTGRLYRLASRIRQRKDSAYKSGYSDAIQDAIREAGDCDSLEVTTVTRCRECANASEKDTTMPFCFIQNRRKAPDDYCNLGNKDYE